MLNKMCDINKFLLVYIIISMILSFAVQVIAHDYSKLINNEGQREVPAWGFHLGLLGVYRNVSHSSIEGRIGIFQSDNELPHNIFPKIILGIRRKNNILELDGSFDFSGNDHIFLDRGHIIQVNEWHLQVWFRRQVPLDLINNRMHLLPGAGLGYSWADLEVGEDSENTLRMLTGSDYIFAIGMRLDMELTQLREGLEDISAYLVFDYQYRFDNGITANTENDGYMFFPSGSEFDFSGHNIGLGIFIRN